MLKSGIDYFPLDVDLDTKIQLIEAEFGLKGFAVVVKLFQMIYGKQGYYCEWNEEIALLFGSQTGMGGNAVSEIVSASIRRGIFDKTLYEKYGILSSKGIQKRYWEAAKRRISVEFREEYLLFDDVKNQKNVNILRKNVCRNQKNVCRNYQSREEKSKVEKSREYNTPLYIPPLKGGGDREEKTSKTGVSASSQQSAEPEDSSCLPSAEGFVSVEGSAPSQPKEPKKEKGTTEAQIDEFFSKTWAIYPRKVSKVQARKTYGKKLSGRTSEDARMTANKIFLLLRSHMDEWEEKDRELEFIPHFSTWLNENIEDSPHKRRR